MFRINNRIVLDVFMASCFEGIEILTVTGKHKKHYMRPIRENVSSISSCWGLIEMQKSSICLRSWMDINININGNNTNVCGSDSGLLDVKEHSSQSNGFATKNNINIIKFVSPIRIKCKENIRFVQSSSPFCAQDVNIPSGIVNFKIQHTTNFFMYIPTIDGHKREINFNFGDPILQFTPMSDRKVHLNYICDTQEYEKVCSVERRFSFKNKAYKINKMKI